MKYAKILALLLFALLGCSVASAQNGTFTGIRSGASLPSGSCTPGIFELTATTPSTFYHCDTHSNSWVAVKAVGTSTTPGLCPAGQVPNGIGTNFGAVNCQPLNVAGDVSPIAFGAKFDTHSIRDGTWLAQPARSAVLQHLL